MSATGSVSFLCRLSAAMLGCYNGTKMEFCPESMGPFVDVFTLPSSAIVIGSVCTETGLGIIDMEFEGDDLDACLKGLTTTLLAQGWNVQRGVQQPWFGFVDHATEPSVFTSGNSSLVAFFFEGEQDCRVGCCVMVATGQPVSPSRTEHAVNFPSIHPPKSTQLIDRAIGLGRLDAGNYSRSMATLRSALPLQSIHDDIERQLADSGWTATKRFGENGDYQVTRLNYNSAGCETGVLATWHLEGESYGSFLQIVRMD